MVFGIKKPPHNDLPSDEELGLASKGGPSGGLEVMLKALKLQDVITMAQRLASAGTVQKIIAFGDQLESLNEKIGALNDRFDRLERIISGGAIESGSGDRDASPGGSISGDAGGGIRSIGPDRAT